MVAPRNRIDPNQVTIDYDAPHPSAVATPDDVQALATMLAQYGQLTAGEICAKKGWPITETNKRKIRATASAAFPGIISFVGSAGYKLLKDCTLDELWAADAALAKEELAPKQKRVLLRHAINAKQAGTA